MKQEGRTITLNSKGILLIEVVILTLTFALGFVSSNKRIGNDVTVFTREDLDMINRFQQTEDELMPGADICAYKDKNGNLMLGWCHDDQKGLK